MKKAIREGFTLIELLIVMAILGVLAVVVLVAINPAEQLARTRDAGRVSAVTQIGHAIQAYYTSQNAVYPTAATWNTDLEDSGELSTVPAEITYAGTATPCAGPTEFNGWCYKTASGADAIIYSKLESLSYTAKCSTGQTAYILYSATDGRGGTWCGGSEPAAGSGFTFVP